MLKWSNYFVMGQDFSYMKLWVMKSAVYTNKTCMNYVPDREFTICIQNKECWKIQNVPNSAFRCVSMWQPFSEHIRIYFSLSPQCLITFCCAVYKIPWTCTTDLGETQCYRTKIYMVALIICKPITNLWNIYIWTA